ncbi:GNAT family N-acetyltransferase [Mycobacterium sp. NAZ190054]|uniref:GNAT family N-acetyltransferase n=1 Tax=Mycobacterium sp. NAZ190054 TaxID=1747766 RepID=UPI000795E825|nr:GNAT family N-acetyltransferase [Mycobacterium sp. NAZ190054]KWX65911.1 acetyltransferase [Mycobacterium sp. NAZ190054]
MTTDKTGAPTEVATESDRFSISVDGTKAGFTEYVDHGNQRIFPHTEIDDAFSGRGLATILVGEALETTRAEGKRIVAVCSMVAGFIDKHPEFNDVVDPVTTDIKRILSSR